MQHISRPKHPCTPLCLTNHSNVRELLHTHRLPRGTFYQPIVKILNAEYFNQQASAPLGGSAWVCSKSWLLTTWPRNFTPGDFKFTSLTYHECMLHSKLVRKIDFEQVEGVDLHLGLLADTRIYVGKTQVYTS